MELINRDELKRKFIEKSKKVHKGENLDYSKVEYINNKTPVIIVDRDLKPDGTEYGEYSILPMNHLKGQKHPEKKGFKTKDEWLELVEEMKKVHKNENLEYPEQTFKNKNSKIRIIDHDKDSDGNEYGEYYQTILSHLKGSCHPRKSQQKRRNNEETKTGKVQLDETVVCKDYVEGKSSIRDLSAKYHVGELKIKEILKKNGIELKKRGAQFQENNFVVSDPKTKKYVERDGFHYIARDRKTGYETNDIYNNGGFLTKHIENEYGVEIPRLLEREKYYQRTGNYWWEQWFDIIEVEDKPVKKCPYCDWTTTDLENKSGMFETHLKKEHKKTLREYLTEFPEDEPFFKKRIKKVIHEIRLENDESRVKCPLCGKFYERLTDVHMKNYHSMTLSEFKEKYPKQSIMSQENLKQARESQRLANLTVSKSRFVSKYEKELQNFLTDNGIKFECNRQILIGKEIDILVEDKKIGIEFNGLKFHTEFFGKKNHNYHLEKTLKCNEKGYGLVHIFEDEFVNHKEIVFSKLKHILGINENLEKIYARKCKISEILKSDAKKFLDKNHIQGYVNSTVYLGAYYNDELVAVMTFKNGTIKNKGWELSRFATDNTKRVIGIGGKLFAYFIRNYEPDYVFSFADRRWTVDINNNLYTKIGFKIESITRPDYTYYNEKIDGYKRFHKMFLNKQSLSKKYGFPMTMTEREMCDSLGFYRIWDCGLIKYVYKKEK